MKEKPYTPKQATEILGTHTRTLQNWDKEGKIKVVLTPNRRRRIPESEINRLFGKESNIERNLAIYDRVSSHEQKTKGDLERQVKYVLSKINSEKYINITTITDVGSGLNDKRKGLLKLMDMAKNKEISNIAISYKDRLTRFGYNYLETYFNSNGVAILIVNNDEDKSPKQELIEDLMSITTSFSGKLYGLRSRKHKVVEEKIKEVVIDVLHLQDEDTSKSDDASGKRNRVSK